MTSSLTLSLPEIALFLSAAIVLGITLRLFIGTQNTMKAATVANKPDTDNSEWKTKYMSDMQKRDKELAILKEKLKQSGNHVKTLSTKAEELRWQHKRFETIKEQLEKELSDLDKKNKLRPVVIPEKKGLVANGR